MTETRRTTESVLSQVTKGDVDRLASDLVTICGIPCTITMAYGKWLVILVPLEQECRILPRNECTLSAGYVNDDPIFTLDSSSTKRTALCST